MNSKLFNKLFISNILLVAVVFLLPACNSTKHLKEGQYLLRKNKVNIKYEGKLTQKVEIKDNLNKIIVQKPNANFLGFLPFPTPTKLWLYNLRYRKLHRRPDSLLPKSVERPVILDTVYMQRSALNMKNYMFNRGYFYAKVTDTYLVKKKKAYATYTIEPGINYQINDVRYYIDDSEIARIVRKGAGGTILKKDREFTYSLTGDERNRLVNDIRNNGYYKFTQENITFIIDTVDKSIFKDAESPFKAAVDFVSAIDNKKPTLDLEVHIQLADDSAAFTKYIIKNINVYLDFVSPADLKDSSLTIKRIGKLDFWFHSQYVHPWVLYKHIYVAPGNYFNQTDYDKTQAKLTELGIFQYIRIVPREMRRNRGVLDYDILLARAKKYDFSTLYELTSGSTYALGHSIGINFRDKNFLKGANLLTIGVNGGLEYAYNSNSSEGFFRRFSWLTSYYGINASIDFPKFLAPVASSLFSNSNLPHTIIGGGRSVIDRINYFTLSNTSANFSYSWKETQSKTWGFSPAFVNIIRLPYKSYAFDTVLANNEYLKNSYKENFIEGENITYTFDNIAAKRGINHSYLKVGLEEAGALLSLVNNVVDKVNNLYSIQYAQYAKFDLDARHYFTFRKTVVAMRFLGGIGVPYDKSATLPYIKQYFSGGPYSLRGWRIRTLGPGTYFNPNTGGATQIDRTGDIKLELNSELRFPITLLFSGAIKMNGAVFADAGNIWLAKKDPAYPGGNFEFKNLGQDVAADIGLGVRFDIASFLTLRADLAMPVKKPEVAINNGWVFDQVNFNNPTWRSQNLIMNISIGYPF
ncbi:MAG: surface antigen [Flavipsychrobacter sp.]|jgi:outer membrane protein assembly factor BamA|nr:surface antigen [Flavipsychrobacter sp.]